MHKPNARWVEQENQLADLLGCVLTAYAAYWPKRPQMTTRVIVQRIRAVFGDDFGTTGSTVARRVRGAMALLQKRGKPYGNLGGGYQRLTSDQRLACADKLEKVLISEARRACGLRWLTLESEMAHLLGRTKQSSTWALAVDKHPL